LEGCASLFEFNTQARNIVIISDCLALHQLGVFTPGMEKYLFNGLDTEGLLSYVLCAGNKRIHFFDLDVGRSRRSAILSIGAC
jgi:hypothetical protein